jgi:hypothetical protein
MALCTAVQLASCGSVHTGPKNIEADGVSYTACDGAIWFSNSNDLRDPLLKTYTVIFKDARGVEHEMDTVRRLKVTDLPADTRDCANPPQ